MSRATDVPATVQSDLADVEEPQPGPRKTDLVYIERSPNFCEANPYSPGTRDRQCDKDTNCDSICCGRGYNIRSLLVTRRCDCRFMWCCEVICNECTTREEIQLCK